MPTGKVSSDPLQDTFRLVTLKATHLLDTPPEEAFDRCTRLASRAVQAPIALVSLVDNRRQFFKSQVGLPEPWASERELPLSHSFCQHLVRSRDSLVVSDARCHELLHDNLAIRDLNMLSYLGIPLRTHDGQILGSFCAIDTRPREWTGNEIEIMRELAAAVTDEVELRLMAGDSVDLLHALRELEQARDEMVHMLVHDLRDPLSSLMAGLDMMASHPSLDEEQRNYLGWAEKGGQDLLEKINEILTLSKAEYGALALAREPVEAEQLIRHATNQLRYLARSAGIKVSVQVPESPLEFTGDRASLERVLVNLIANAIKHTPTGGHIEITARQEKTDTVVFCVSDNGEGLPSGAEQWIFDKYRQSASKQRQRGHSSGLGLPFCKLVVTAHGGSLEAQNQPDGGARFCFTLPRTGPGAQPPD